MISIAAYCIVAFFLGLGIGWAVFGRDLKEDEDDGLSDSDLCNGCVQLTCISDQDSNNGYCWYCSKTGRIVETTDAQTDTIKRPDWCASKDD
jgi:hypothetical protein